MTFFVQYVVPNQTGVAGKANSIISPPAWHFSAAAAVWLAQHICTSALMRLLKWKDANWATFITMEEERLNKMWYIRNRGRDGAGTQVVNEFILVLLQKGSGMMDSWFELNNGNSNNMNSNARAYHLWYKPKLKALLPAAWANGVSGRKWRRCPWGRTQDRAGRLWREGYKWRRY